MGIIWLFITAHYFKNIIQQRGGLFFITCQWNFHHLTWGSIFMMVHWCSVNGLKCAPLSRDISTASGEFLSCVIILWLHRLKCRNVKTSKALCGFEFGIHVDPSSMSRWFYPHLLPLMFPLRCLCIKEHFKSQHLKKKKKKVWQVELHIYKYTQQILDFKILYFINNV